MTTLPSANRLKGPWSTRGKPSIVETHPDLAVQFVEVVNQGSRAPDTITAGMGLMVVWRCPEKGHTCPALMLNRKYGRGCGPCGRGEPGPDEEPGKAVYRGQSGRLRDLMPGLRDEFVEMVEGARFSFDEVSAATQARALWRCRNCQHEWVSTVGNRYNHGTHCPECADLARWVAKREASLGALWADLAAELVEVPDAPHRTAWDLSPNSHFIALWRCSTCALEWRNNISNRTFLGSGCPRCKRATNRVFEGDSLEESTLSWRRRSCASSTWTGRRATVPLHRYGAGRAGERSGSARHRGVVMSGRA